MKMKKSKFASFLICIAACHFQIFAQNSIGLIQRTDESFDAFTLFTPQNSKFTYLIDNCGVVVHDWESEFFPGNSVYLQKMETY